MLFEENYCNELCDDLESDQTGFYENLIKNLDLVALTSSVDKYIKYQKIGQGTFGEVFKVRHKESKQHFALKKIRMEQEKEGFPITALREIRILKSLNHENIVALREICHSIPSEKNNYIPQFYLVFEFCDHDLAGLSKQVDFSDAVKKAIMKQLFTGVYYLHKNNIIHRDLKAANILIDKNGTLKIADFGLARCTLKSLRVDRPNRYTGRVVTLWYRPPEILLNDRYYGKPVDLWGTGCIMAELWTKYAIMQGDNEINQLKLIINLCGSITQEIWPAVTNLEAFHEAKLPSDIKRHVREKLTTQISCPLAVDLIDKLLVLDPAKRLDADQALNHEYFFSEPQIGDLRVFSKSGSSYLEFLSNPHAHPSAIPSGSNRAISGLVPSSANRGSMGAFRGQVPSTGSRFVPQGVYHPYQVYTSATGLGLPPAHHGHHGHGNHQFGINNSKQVKGAQQQTSHVRGRVPPDDSIYDRIY